MKQDWTEKDLDEMSWHDNAVHGLSIIEGQHGSGELVLDLDHILEWLPAQREKGFQFCVAPAELRFQEVTNLKILLDYVTPTAALTPFAIHQIRFEPVIYSNATASRRWTIEINWPVGEITFQAPRFTQVLTGGALVTDAQSLSQEQRRMLRRAKP